jgi:hypothetical protein
MAKEYNRIPVPRGSTVTISNNEDKYIAVGTLLEDYTISLNSDFGQLMDSGSPTGATVLGGVLNSLSNGRFGFSGTFKHMGFQIWKGTEPIQIQFTLEFHYTYSGYEEVVAPIRRLCKIPLPGEGGIAGTLIPPGPSVLEAISGVSSSNRPPSGDAPAPEDIDEEAIEGTANTYVNISIGGMQFMGCIIKQAEPTFSKYVDEQDYPIYGRVAITAITMYTATKENIDYIMRGGHSRGDQAKQEDENAFG